MVRAFGLVLAIWAVSLSLGWNAPALGAELTPETRKLFDAVRANNFSAVKRSLLAGADIRAENATGRTAVDLAIDKSYFPIAHYLLAWRKQRKAVKARALPPEAPETFPEKEQVTPPEPVVSEAKPEPVPVQVAPPVTETARQEPVPAVKPEPAPVQVASPEKPASVEEKGGFFDTITGFFTSEQETPEPQTIAPPEPLKQENEAVKQEETAPTIQEEEKAEEITAAPEAEESLDILKSITDFFSFEDKQQQEAGSGETATGKQQEAGSGETATGKQPEAAGEAAGSGVSPAAPVAPEPKEPEPAATAQPAPVEPEKVETAKVETPKEEPKEESQETILGRISEFLRPATGDSPAATEPLPARGESDKGFKKLQTAAAPSGPPPPATGGGPITLGYNPFLTPEMSLGKNQPNKPDKTCIEKKSWQSLFCIEPVLWPQGPKESQDIGASFEVYTTLFRGQQTIVRYEKGRATQFHTLFPSKNYYAIIDYFTKQFGPPSEKPGIRAVLVGEADRKNRTARWFGPKRKDGKAVVLEVREIDDLRWSAPPDPRYGVVWLYFRGADPVFRYVSWSDFLLARVRRRGK